MKRALPLLALTLAGAALAGSHLTLDLDDARADSVFEVLGDATRQQFVVPDCAASRRVDLSLENVPPELALDVLALQLGLTYQDVDGVTLVECRTSQVDPALLQQRVSVEVRDASSRAVLELLAAQAGLSADYNAPEVSVSLVLHDVQLATAIQALQETARLAEIRVEDGVLVAESLRPMTEPLDAAPLNATLELLRSLEPMDCPGPFDRGDRAVVGLILDDQGRIHRSWVMALEVAQPRSKACVREQAEGWADPDAGPPAAYAELPLMLVEELGLPAGEPAPTWMTDLLPPDAQARCWDSLCQAVVVLPDNAAIAVLMESLQVGGHVNLTHIQPEPTGGKRALIEVRPE
jgi:hypothetical protein